MALEAHIERPAESTAFQKFPKILANTPRRRHHLRLSTYDRHERG